MALQSPHIQLCDTCVVVVHCGINSMSLICFDVVVVSFRLLLPHSVHLSSLWCSVLEERLWCEVPLCPFLRPGFLCCAGSVKFSLSGGNGVVGRRRVGILIVCKELCLFDDCQILLGYLHFQPIDYTKCLLQMDVSFLHFCNKLGHLVA